MKVLYVGNVLPLTVVEYLNLSIAGKKYELNLIEFMDDILKEDLSVISLSKVGKKECEQLNVNYIFKNKKFIQTICLKIPIINDFIRNLHFTYILFLWSWNNNSTKSTVVILNSPFGISLIALMFKFIFKYKLLSLTIDTPFPNINNRFYIYRKYQFFLGKMGHYLLNYFDGIITLNINVIKVLNLNIPYHLTKIGFNNQLYNNKNEAFNKNFEKHNKRIIVFAGTLIDYNGIIHLIKGFELLEADKYELHIYGYGPLVDTVIEYEKINKNIIFHGRVGNHKLLSIFENADLLVNPRVVLNDVNDFGFPSKLIEYILSGKPVLTTRFASLPKDYESFLYIISDTSPVGMCEAIESVFKDTSMVIKAKCLNGVNKVRIDNNWNKISNDMVDFIKL